LFPAFLLPSMAPAKPAHVVAAHAELKAASAVHARDATGGFQALLSAQDKLSDALLIADGRGIDVDTEGACASLDAVRRGLAAARSKAQRDNAGSLAVYLRAAAEIHMWAGNYHEAQRLLSEAMELFPMAGLATDHHSEELVACQRMLAICVQRLPGRSLPLVAKTSDVTLRPLTDCDQPFVDKLCRTMRKCSNQAFAAQAAVKSIMTASPEQCLAATSVDGTVVGAALAATDGSFGYIGQPVVDRERLGNEIACHVEALLREGAATALCDRGVFGIHEINFGANMVTDASHVLYAL